MFDVAAVVPAVVAAVVMLEAGGDPVGKFSVSVATVSSRMKFSFRSSWFGSGLIDAGKFGVVVMAREPPNKAWLCGDEYAAA